LIDTLYLEGEELRVAELGHTDTADSTALHVPSIGLVVSGDAVYNNTHLYLAECDGDARGEWLRALDKIEALHPRAVIAGHGVFDLSDRFRARPLPVVPPRRRRVLFRSSRFHPVTTTVLPCHGSAIEMLSSAMTSAGK
jgi:glyoxylase-like metal-dependent hydrolase (beta-lactamase superfamily II)